MKPDFTLRAYLAAEVGRKSAMKNKTSGLGGKMKATDALREAGEKIINEMRTELYLSLPFMGPALSWVLPWMLSPVSRTERR